MNPGSEPVTITGNRRNLQSTSSGSSKVLKLTMYMLKHKHESETVTLSSYGLEAALQRFYTRIPHVLPNIRWK